MADQLRRDAAVRAATRIAEMNQERDDRFQDAAMAEIWLALDAFRAAQQDRQPSVEGFEQAVEAEVPATGEDPLLDALMGLTRELDASPETVSIACARVLELAGRPGGVAKEQPPSTVP